MLLRLTWGLTSDRHADARAGNGSGVSDFRAAAVPIRDVRRCLLETTGDSVVASQPPFPETPGSAPVDVPVPTPVDPIPPQPRDPVAPAPSDFPASGTAPMFEGP